MGKKRVQLSLAFNTDSDSLYERVHFNDTTKTKIIDRPSRVTGTSSISLTTCPYEYSAEHTIEGNKIIKESSATIQTKEEPTYDQGGFG